jgi:hypothetical protein
MALNPASDIMALHQRRQNRRRRRTAIPARRIPTARFAPRWCGNAGKPNDAIPQAKGLAIKNADLRRLSREGAIRRGRTEKIGRQAKTQEKRRNHGANNPKPRTAEAGAHLPSLEDTSWFTHT